MCGPLTGYSMFGYFIVYLLVVSFVNCAFQYQIEFNDPKIISKCEEHPDKYIDRHFDLTKLVYTTLDNGTIDIKGPLKMVKNVAPSTKLTISIFKRNRGQWSNTLFNMHRPDVCTAAFSPAEFWYEFTRPLPEEQRVCPFPDDFTVDLDFSTAIVFALPGKNAEGDYKIELMMSNTLDPDVFACFNVIGTVFKAE